jgi:hypothetical protein
MLSLHVFHQPEPVLYNLRILTEGSLIITISIKFHFQLGGTFDQGRSP